MPGIRGALAFLYRMMKLREYNIPEVLDMEVWEVAVALDVDWHWEPDGLGGTVDKGPVVVDDDLMNMPTEMSEMTLEQLMGGGSIGQIE